ncbi:MAG: biotin/lipoyl-binding protein [Pseudomonadota bacterium]
MAGDASTPLPPLREDLELVDESGSAEGGWLIYDSARHRYFAVERSAFELLSRWCHYDTAEALLRAVASETPCAVTAAEFDWLVQFLHQHNLLRCDSPGMGGVYAHQREHSRKAFWRQALHSYLFFRVPLVRPDRFLSATLPYVTPLFRKQVAIVLLLLSLLGLFLAARQWDVFLATFQEFTSLESIVSFALALFAVKVVHELGHAYTAKRYGCRIPTMGIAFLVMWPVLYTDTTDAWRVRDRRARLAIGAAGMLAELALAGLATLAWSFLPDGPLRSAAFFIATTSWVMTLLVNLNPFMRFDGYYLLSDLLGVRNLQERGFALGRWRLREALFGLKEPSPEVLSRRLRRILILYAWGTWIYRFLLFLGIALLVYHFFFKLLGVFLFAVEIGWFIVRPIVLEMREWWRRAERFHLNRQVVVLGLIALLLAGVLLFPWSSRVEVPALYVAERQVTLFPPAPAQIRAVYVQEGQQVEAGELLFELHSPQLRHEMGQAGRRIAILEHRIATQAASIERLDNIAVLQQELAAERSALRGFRERSEQLRIVAPLSGRVVDLDQTARDGVWVGERAALGRITRPDLALLRGYLEGGEQLGRIESGAAARFYPDDPARAPMEAEVIRIDSVNLRSLDKPYVASIYDGPIPVREGREGALVPEHSVYRIVFRPKTTQPVDQVVRGTVYVSADARSLLQRAWRSVVAVLIRESGF